MIRRIFEAFGQGAAREGRRAVEHDRDLVGVLGADAGFVSAGVRAVRNAARVVRDAAWAHAAP